MFQRLCMLALLAVAALSVSTPAHASTPVSVYLSCYQVGAQPPWYANYDCTGSASGGTGSYTYTWKVYSSYGWYTFSGGTEFSWTCGRDEQFRIDLYVTDSAGSTASVMGDSFACNVGDIQPL